MPGHRRAQAAEIGAVAWAAAPSRTLFHAFSSGRKRLSAGLRRRVGRERHKYMENECVRYRRTDSAAMFDGKRFHRELGFRPRPISPSAITISPMPFPALFHTGWPEALLYTADGGGDNVQYSMRLFRDGS